MKKAFFSKITALFLSLVMVAVMVPLGAVNVFAVADVDTTADTVIIDSVDDWKAVASSGKDFAGQTVKLDADIAFGNEAAPALFATLKGTFLGNGKTVSGTALSGKNLIATTVDGGTIDGEGMTISGFIYNTTNNQNVAIVAGTLNAGSAVKNITVDGCSITTDKSLAGFIVGVANGTDFNNNKALVENCSVVNCTASFAHQSGFIVGAVTKYVTIKECDVSNSTLVSSSAAVAAILGKMNGGTHADISDCTVGSDVSITCNNISDGYAECTGMVVGLAGYDVENLSDGAVKMKDVGTNGSLSITNCTVNGTIIAANTKGVNTSVGGVVGAIGLKGESVISGNTVNVTITAPSGKAYVGGIIGSSAAILTVSENTVQATITSPNNATGGVIGYYAGQGSNAFTVSKCKISGVVYETANGGGSPRIGGVVGRVVENTVSASTGKNTIAQCDVAFDMYASCQYAKLGGVIGSWGNSAMDATLSICDCYVGSVLAVSSTGGKGAGVVSEVKAKNVTVESVLVAATMTQTTFDTTNKTFAKVDNNNTVWNKTVGALLFNSKSSEVATPAVTNCYTTIDGDNASFLEISNEEILSNLVKYDAKGFIERVNDYVRCGLVQVSNAVNGSYMVRFIGTSIFDNVESAHMKVTATLGDDVRVFEADCTAYDVLTAHTTATQIASVASESFGAEKFVAVTVNGIPAASANEIVFDIELTVTAGGVNYTASVSDMLIPPVAA